MSRRRNYQLQDDSEDQPIGKHSFEHSQSIDLEKAVIVPGQRWISEMEPELGPGQIISADHRRVTIAFHDGATTRIYTRENAPLRRVLFKTGDQIRARDGRSGVVKSVEEKNNLIIYHTETIDIPEKDLSDSISITAPFDRLLAGYTDANRDFNLRMSVLKLKEKIAGSSLRGFTGGRIELIPHQLYIAHETTSRHIRRIMLADEVGLGKTIEACLILHRLLVSGRAVQALVIVPDALVNVWFVELLRKFNILFRIIDKEYVESFLSEETDVNPFQEDSLILTSMGILSRYGEFASFAAEVRWDMLIVDEAHHLREGGREFEIVDSISKMSKDLLLLTATPQQYGERGHFSRLRMLDPSRYGDFESFVKESEIHRRIAGVTGKLLDGETLSEKDVNLLRELLNDNSLGVENFNGLSDGKNNEFRHELVAELLDRHGIGRAMFRNTRLGIGGFPSREVFMEKLDGSKACRQLIKQAFTDDLEGRAGERNFKDDPRIAFIAELLRKLDNEKVLVICRSKETASAIDEALKKEINVNTALFHEDLTLIQRDRNAAWFAEEEGARILLCSEIGSEGRNFQFVHNLVLFDLPFDPELVEQRIGRLDRIGQKGPIRIHVPYVEGTPDGCLAQWFHVGLGIFGSTAPAGQEVFETLKDELFRFVNACEDAGSQKKTWEDFLERTKKLTLEVSERLKAGRDRLLEQHSFRPREAATIVNAVAALDNDKEMMKVMEKLFTSRGILVEAFNQHTWKLWADGGIDEAFPGLRSSTEVVTFDRKTALHREDIEFLTIDHPAVHGGIDLFLSSQSGNAALAVCKGAAAGRGLFMDALFVAECIAPKELYVDRFLPPVVLRVVVNHELKESREFAMGKYDDRLEEVADIPVLETSEVKKKLLPSMQRKALEIAQERCEMLVKNAVDKATKAAGGEVERLKALRKNNPAVTEQEIATAESETMELIKNVHNTVPRLDAVRIVLSQG